MENYFRNKQLPEFFYCYSPNLYQFFKRRGIQYICTGLSSDTMKRFWQFRSVEVESALTEWRQHQKRVWEQKGVINTLSE